jgi:hypothetical protein
MDEEIEEDDEVEEMDVIPTSKIDERQRRYFPSDRRNIDRKKLEKMKKQKSIVDRVLEFSQKFGGK